MEYQVVWTAQAEEDFNKVIEYLHHHWPDDVVLRFVQRTSGLTAYLLQARKFAVLL